MNNQSVSATEPVVTEKKQWQTPELTEISKLSIEAGPAGITDAGIFS